MEEKIVGYLLLFTGVSIILLSGISVYTVFTKRAQPVSLFTFSGISIDMSKIVSGAISPEIQNSGIQLPEIKQELISADMVNAPLNLIFHTVLMGFLATIGLKIGQLGTMMLRSITVHLKEKKD